MKETIDILAGGCVYRFGPERLTAVITALPHNVSYSGTNVFRYSLYRDEDYAGPSLAGKIIRSFHVSGTITRNASELFAQGLVLEYGGATSSRGEIPFGNIPIGSGATPFDIHQPDTSVPIAQTTDIPGFWIRWQNGSNGPFNYTVPSDFCTVAQMDIDDMPSWTILSAPAEFVVGEAREIVLEAGYPSGEAVVGTRWLAQTSSGDIVFEGGDTVATLTSDSNGQARLRVIGVHPATNALISFMNEDGSDIWVFGGSEFLDLPVEGGSQECFWTDIVGAEQDCP